MLTSVLELSHGTSQWIHHSSLCDQLQKTSHLWLRTINCVKLQNYNSYKKNTDVWLGYYCYSENTVIQLHSCVHVCSAVTEQPQCKFTNHHIINWHYLKNFKRKVDEALEAVGMIYTVSPPKVHLLFWITLSKINRFKWFLACEILRKFDTKTLHIVHLSVKCSTVP